MVLGIALIFAASMGETRGDMVDEIRYSGRLLDGLYMIGSTNEWIGDDAPIQIALRGEAASKAFLTSLTGGLPSAADPVQSGLAYMGVLSVRGSGLAGDYYTDGEYLCSGTGHCRPVGARFRAFIDPTYVEAEAVLRVF